MFQEIFFNKLGVSVCHGRQVSTKEHDMTTPAERTRSLRYAGEFLREVESRTDVELELRRQAKVILRHYPSEAEIRIRARIGVDLGMPWLAPEEP